MREEIKQRIEQIKNGAVPDGYISTKAGVLPKWDCAHINQIAEPITDKVGDGTYETLSISAGIGFVNQAKKFGKELSGKQYEKYTVLKRGDFSYNKGNSKTYPQGCIYRLKDRETAAVPNVFESFVVKKGNPDYYEQLFISGFLNKQLSTKINHGVRDDGLLNLTGKDFYSCYLPVPPLEEQQKIAKIIMQCDKVIELKQKRIEEEKKLKRGLVNKIFNDSFFTKSVTAYKTFGEIFDIVTDYVSNGSFADLRNNVTYLESGFAVLIRTADYNNNFKDDEFIYVDEHAYKFLANSVVYPGDIVISNVGSVGTVFKVPDLKKPMSLAPNTILVRTHNQNMEYMYQYLISPKGQDHIMSITSKTAMPKFNKTDFKNIKIRLHSLDEQLHIACALKAYDDKINLLEKELGQWKKKKKSLMQLLLTGIVRVKV